MDTLIMDQGLEIPAQPIDPEIEEMSKAGVHLGHAKSKFHPSMAPYIFGVRNYVSLIDLMKTKEKLDLAREFIRAVATKKGIILLVGTRPAAKKIIREMGEKTGMPYFSERWIGGTLTNYKVVSKRVEYLERLVEERKTGEFEKYTKKERMKKGEEIERLTKFFGGVRSLKRMPDAVFVVDITHDLIAVNEARKVKIPVIALVDTNSNADLVTWAIPANDDALPSVRYMCGRVLAAIEEGMRDAKASQDQEPAPQKVS